jgi:putative photosynthetic complex assembly protein
MADLAVRRQTNGMPKEVLTFAAVMIAIVIAGSWTARLSGLGRAAPPIAEAVQSLSLRFDDQQDGSVLVRRANDGAAIYRIAPETNGFMRATLRGLARERRRSGVGAETAFVLTYWNDGRMSLEDPTTGRRVALEAFGETNAGAFARLFQASGGVR